MKQTEQLKHEIKEIIYGCAKKGGICEDIEDGQIIGLRTGEGLEFDMVTQGIAQWHIDKVLEIMETLKKNIYDSPTM